MPEFDIFNLTESTTKAVVLIDAKQLDRIEQKLNYLKWFMELTAQVSLEPTQSVAIRHRNAEKLRKTKPEWPDDPRSG